MPRKRGLLANLRSCVFNTSLAIFAEETTRVGLEPKRNDMSGPWRFESCHREWCRDDLSSWCRFPIRGRLAGPGGRDALLLALCVLCLWIIMYRIEINKERSTGTASMMQGLQIESLSSKFIEVTYS